MRVTHWLFMFGLLCGVWSCWTHVVWAQAALLPCWMCVEEVSWTGRLQRWWDWWRGRKPRRKRGRPRRPKPSAKPQAKPSAPSPRRSVRRKHRDTRRERAVTVTPTSPQPQPASPLATWVDREVGQTALGDARLTKRLSRLVTDFASQPTATIPEACGSWSQTKAAYRFFAHPELTPSQILGGSRQACLDRLGEEDVVLIVQDTMSLDYTSHPGTTGLGTLEATSHQGIFVHSSMAVNCAGVPLGLVDQQSWARDPATTGKRATRKHRPIEEKESFKWLKGLRQSLQDVPASVCLVTVADREADIFELFDDAATHDTHVLIRRAWNRCIEGELTHIQDAVDARPVAGTCQVAVGRAPGRLPRDATMAVRFTTVCVCPPRRSTRQKALHPLTMSVVDVQEIAPPTGQEALHWRLLTSRSVQTVEEALRCVRWYSLRWLIERYHFVLKSGCRIETRQLSTAARLQNCLSVYAIVAWRLLWMTYQARETSEASCEVAFTRDEWQTLYCVIHRCADPPETPPSLQEAVGWVAQLGGFLHRKGDKHPGVKVLWRGWQRLQDYVAMWQILHPPP